MTVPVFLTLLCKDGYIHWDRSYEAFLLKKHNNRLLAVFKIGTKAAVSLEITLNGLGSTSYINLEIFLPKIQEFKNFKTYGLLGSYDDDISNDCKQRDGSNHNISKIVSFLQCSNSGILISCHSKVKKTGTVITT